MGTAAAFAEVGNLTDGHFGSAGNTNNAGQTPGQYFGTAHYFENILGHALVGCASGAASGKSCASGAASAAVSDAVTPVYSGASLAAGTALSATTGAATAALTGGSVAQGAITGVYGYLYNVQGVSIGFRHLYNYVMSNIFEDAYVPDTLLPNSSKFILQGRTLMPDGSVAVPIPQGYVSELSDNGQGIVFRAPGTTGNENIIRLAEPNDYTPYRYMKVYNGNGQQISPYSGRTVSNKDSHYPFVGTTYTE